MRGFPCGMQNETLFKRSQHGSLPTCTDYSSVAKSAPVPLPAQLPRPPGQTSAALAGSPPVRGATPSPAAWLVPPAQSTSKLSKRGLARMTPGKRFVSRWSALLYMWFCEYTATPEVHNTHLCRMLQFGKPREPGLLLGGPLLDGDILWVGCFPPRGQTLQPTHESMV